MKNKLTALKITLIYVIFGIVWIYFSDRALAVLVPDPEMYIKFQSYKGLFYVAFTGLFLFALIRSYFSDLGKSYKQISESLEQIRKITESMVVGVLIVDVNNPSFLFSNKSLQAMLGYSEKEINSFNLEAGQDKEPLRELFFTIKKISTGEIIEKNGLPIKKRSGSIFIVDLSVTNIIYQDKNCLLAVFHDVSEEMVLQTQIAEERNFLKALLDVSGVIILAINQEQEVILINPKGCDLMGYQENEILWKNWPDNFLPERIRKEVKEYLDLILKGETDFNPYNENPVLTKTGEEKEIFWHNAVLRDEQGDIYACLCSGLDITEIMKVKRTLEEVTEFNKKLKELDDLKSLFIASMSHELRTPLNSIIGFTSIILNEWLGPLNDEQKENLSTVLKSGKYLFSLINDVIDVAKIESGTLEVNVERFALDQLINEVVNNLSLEIEKSGLDLILKLKPIEIATDKKRLTQCIYNLLTNALKFTESGNVKISNQLDKEFVEISVEDTGLGMTSEELNKLFTPFTRMRASVRGKLSGMGLGLYLTRKMITEILQGELLVDSEAGKGSRFTIRVPLKVKYNSAG